MATPVMSSGLQFRPPRLVVRRDGPLGGYESALARAGFGRVAGADEAGRGACAGPLVVAACILPNSRRGKIDGLDDSKLLTAPTRERLYHEVVARALAYSIVIIPAAEIDAFGLHVANLAGMRRALCTLTPCAQYALTDGFPVSGLGMPSTAMWKGDATVACIAAASILAKVTRDAIMTSMHDDWPQYDFAAHKGYITSAHSQALAQWGPCPQHRRRYVNVRRVMGYAAPVHENVSDGGKRSMSDACGAVNQYLRDEGVLAPPTGPSTTSGPEEVR
jgi:ribonuclease HII